MPSDHRVVMPTEREHDDQMLVTVTPNVVIEPGCQSLAWSRPPNRRRLMLLAPRNSRSSSLSSCRSAWAVARRFSG